MEFIRQHSGLVKILLHENPDQEVTLDIICPPGVELSAFGSHIEILQHVSGKPKFYRYLCGLNPIEQLEGKTKEEHMALIEICKYLDIQPSCGAMLIDLIMCGYESLDVNLDDRPNVMTETLATFMFQTPPPWIDRYMKSPMSWHPWIAKGFWRSDSKNLWACIGEAEGLEYAYKQNKDWLDEHHFALAHDFSMNACVIATIFNHVDCLRFACENGCPLESIVTYIAAESGYIDCLQYLYEGYHIAPVECNDSVCEYAAIGGHIDCLIYLRQQGAQWGDVMNYAASNDQLECLKWLHAQGAPYDEDVFSYSADSGNIECLKWLYENCTDTTWDRFTCIFAINNNEIECLKYALEHGCPYDIKDLYIYAASNKTAECLEYLYSFQKTTLETEHCNEAAKAGSLECLEWLVAHGAPFDESTTAMAATVYFKNDMSSPEKQIECLRWLHENGAPWDEKTCSTAADEGNLYCLKYAHENGAPWDEITCLLADKFECLQYAIENGCPCPSSVLKNYKKRLTTRKIISTLQRINQKPQQYLV